jgi:hypothetical protein
MRKLLALAALLTAPGCAGFEPLGAAGKEETLYCYQALVGIDCYKTPYHRDERRLIAYTGPAPETYPKPMPPPDPRLFAPEMVSYWVKDPEPVPTAAPGKTRAVSRETLPPRR